VTADTILVDGTDLQTTARIIQSWGGVHSIAEQRGSGFVVPGRHGVVDDIDRPFDAGILSLGMLLRGGAPDVTGFNDQLRTLQRLVKPGRKVTLTRRLTFTSGTEDHTTVARCQPFTPDMLTPADGRFVLNFELLDGLWYGTQVSFTRGASSAQTITGDTVTRRITLTLPGSGTLTNSTTGTAVTVTGAHTLNVEARTTTGSLANVSSVGDPLGAWFSLAPGSNTIGWAGSGTATIAYNPAYL
jgi:hypothetical protein